MKNNIASKFKIPKGSRIYPTVARRHGVTKVYVRLIALGLRNTKTAKARSIAKDLEETVRFLNRPITIPPPPEVELNHNKNQ